MEGVVQISSPWDTATRHMGRFRSCIRAGLDWTLGSISLPPRELVNAPRLSVP